VVRIQISLKTLLGISFAGTVFIRECSGTPKIILKDEGGNRHRFEYNAMLALDFIHSQRAKSLVDPSKSEVVLDFPDS